MASPAPMCVCVLLAALAFMTAMKPDVATSASSLLDRSYCTQNASAALRDNSSVSTRGWAGNISSISGLDYCTALLNRVSQRLDNIEDGSTRKGAVLLMLALSLTSAIVGFCSGAVLVLVLHGSKGGPIFCCKRRGEAKNLQSVVFAIIRRSLIVWGSILVVSILYLQLVVQQ
eukprot:TRINITY_DN4076_c0_g3_i2.p1 TRINITY_DN4076_c0_g3~~TRINITY_DN4076_c0_g3_i2.p1  ORF type:complete len:173 (-),score=12.15 TRINITY_DN4076_c0_g3_i2:144-662(-)